jgi:hypothetical protein
MMFGRRSLIDWAGRDERSGTLLASSHVYPFRLYALRHLPEVVSGRYVGGMQ